MLDNALALTTHSYKQHENHRFRKSLATAVITSFATGFRNSLSVATLLRLFWIVHFWIIGIEAADPRASSRFRIFTTVVPIQLRVPAAVFITESTGGRTVRFNTRFLTTLSNFSRFLPYPFAAFFFIVQ